MTLNLEIVGRTVTDPASWTWTERDTLLYAISVGAGDEGSAADLVLVTENSYGVRQQVMPTFAVVMGMGGGPVSMAEYGDFPLSQVLHAGQKVVLHAPITPSGAVTCTRGVTAIYDKGKNALIETSTVFTDAGTGDRVAESVGQIMVRGEGGFGGDPGPRDTWVPPDRPADHVVVHQTRPNQALLYRLNGDRNPLHSDPNFAARAGFPRPILHGLCTFGFAARALLTAVAAEDCERFGSVAGRFSSPVAPGERLETRVWATSEGARFQTLAGDRVVIDRGEFTPR
jgi:acyl dehydratase